MDVVKGAKNIAKEMTGLNDFKKAKDSFDRAQATSEDVDYSGGLGSDVKNVVAAFPKFTKDIAVGVGDAAVGAGKAIINFIPAGRARKAADVVSKTTLGAFKPKGYVPPTKTPGRQFAPKPNGGVKTPPKPRYSDDALPTNTSDKPTGGYPVNPKPPSAGPKTPTAKPPKKPGLGRAAAFGAGYALGKDDNKDKSTSWNPSAIV